MRLTKYDMSFQFENPVILSSDNPVILSNTKGEVKPNNYIFTFFSDNGLVKLVLKSENNTYKLEDSLKISYTKLKTLESSIKDAKSK